MWLFGEIGEAVRPYEPLITSDLETSLGAYEDYETQVLDELYEHISNIAGALGEGEKQPLEASALSYVCGATLRDWTRSPLRP